MIRFTRGILVAALIAACTESPLPPPPSQAPEPPPPPPPPQQPLAPKMLLVSLKGPTSDDGALLFELKGPAIGAVMPGDSAWSFTSEMIKDSVLRVAILGDLSDRTLLTVMLTERRDVSAYQATILDVTNRTGQLRNSLSAYSIRIEPFGQ